MYTPDPSGWAVHVQSRPPKTLRGIRLPVIHVHPRPLGVGCACTVTATQDPPGYPAARDTRTGQSLWIDLSPAHDEPVCPTGGLSFTWWAHARASSSGQCSCPPDAPPLPDQPAPARALAGAIYFSEEVPLCVRYAPHVGWRGGWGRGRVQDYFLGHFLPCLVCNCSCNRSPGFAVAGSRFALFLCKMARRGSGGVGALPRSARWSPRRVWALASLGCWRPGSRRVWAHGGGPSPECACSSCGAQAILGECGRLRAREQACRG